MERGRARKSTCGRAAKRSRSALCYKASGRGEAGAAWTGRIEWRDFCRPTTLCDRTTDKERSSVRRMDVLEMGVSRRCLWNSRLPRGSNYRSTVDAERVLRRRVPVPPLEFSDLRLPFGIYVGRISKRRMRYSLCATTGMYTAFRRLVHEAPGNAGPYVHGWRTVGKYAPPSDSLVNSLALRLLVHTSHQWKIPNSRR